VSDRLAPGARTKRAGATESQDAVASDDARPAPQVEREAGAADLDDDRRDAGIRDADGRLARACERDARRRRREPERRAGRARARVSGREHEHEHDQGEAGGASHRPITVNVTVAV
jgi:hypothetical protein